MPLTWLTTVTLTAGSLKIFSPEAKLGFLAHAQMVTDKLAAGGLPPGAKTAADAARMIFNDRVDAAVAAFFMISVVVILANSIPLWIAVIRGRKPAISTEVPFTRRAAAAR